MSSLNVLRFFCGLSEAAEDSRCNGCPIKSVSERRSERNKMSDLQSPASDRAPIADTPARSDHAPIADTPARASVSVMRPGPPSQRAGGSPRPGPGPDTGVTGGRYRGQSQELASQVQFRNLNLNAMDNLKKSSSFNLPPAARRTANGESQRLLVLVRTGGGSALRATAE